MFSFAKKPVTQEVILRDLSEDQLTQVAGGAMHHKNDWKNDHDADDKKKKHHHHHHHHHYHHHMKNDHDADDK